MSSGPIARRSEKPMRSSQTPGAVADGHASCRMRERPTWDWRARDGKVVSMAEASEYALEPLREAADFTLYRGTKLDIPVLVMALVDERSSSQGLRRLEHEYSLATELDAAWAAKPLALTRYQGRTVLILKFDPGGEPLDRIIHRAAGQPIHLSLFLQIAIGLAAALGQVHWAGLVHKDVKPANALVDEAGHVWLTGFGIASRIPRERLAPAPAETIAGTLA